MESFTSTLFLETCGLGKYAQQFTSHGYVTLEQCVNLKQEDLSVIGVDSCYGRQELLELAGRLEGRGERDVVQELLVSIPHAELSIISSSRYILIDKQHRGGGSQLVVVWRA